MRYLIKAKEICLADGVLKNTGILVDRGIIVEVGTDNDESAEIIHLDNCRLIPGLIEMHIHGTNGFDVMEANSDSLNGISKHLIYDGVTSFLPTTVTSQPKTLECVLQTVSQYMKTGLDGARILGVYVEGPYISKEYKGAHQEELIRDIYLKEIEDLLCTSDNSIKLMTIAPEKPNSVEAIRYLNRRNVRISLGHSGATYEQAMQAIEAGASIATHIFNGMRPLNHRDTGILGAVMCDERVMAEIICDGVHVDYPAIKIALKCKGDEIILISDSIMARGLPDGEYSLGEQKVFVKDGLARTKEGSLAGSTLSLLKAIKTIVDRCGVPFYRAVNFASLNPAKALGLDHELGSIQCGKAADLVAIDDEYNAVFVMKEGRILL